MSLVNLGIYLDEKKNLSFFQTKGEKKKNKGIWFLVWLFFCQAGFPKFSQLYIM